MTHKDRKESPVLHGLLKYFPDACMYVAHVSFVANEQHNKGEPMHWAKEKSIGTGDEIVRHLMDPEDFDSDGLLHLGKVGWRGMELLQRKIELLKTKNINYMDKEQAIKILGDVSRKAINSKLFTLTECEEIVDAQIALGVNTVEVVIPTEEVVITEEAPVAEEEAVVEDNTCTSCEG
jgi:hypothetical protein